MLQEVLGRTYEDYLSFKHFNLYGETNRNYELIITNFSDKFLHIISTNTDYHYIKFVRYNPQVPHIAIFVVVNQRES
jgi:hypothetical protein